MKLLVHKVFSLLFFFCFPPFSPYILYSQTEPNLTPASLSQTVFLYTLEAASRIKKLDDGAHTINLTGPLNTNTLSKISRAMAAKKNCTFSLDLSETTALYELDKDVLASCPTLQSLTLSDSIIRISFFAFMGSSGLSEIHAPEGNETFASIDGILYTKDFSRLTLVPPGRRGTVTIAAAAREVDGTAFSLSTFVDAIDVESGDTFESIGGLLYSADRTTFIRCPAGRTEPVTLLETVQTLAPHAFENCTKLADIRLNEGLLRAEYGSFALCTSLAQITIPQSVTHIGKQAFYGCTSLQNFSVPKGVSYLGSRSFFKSDIRSLLFEVQEGWIYGRKATRSLENPASNAQEFSHPGRYWSYDVEKDSVN